MFENYHQSFADISLLYVEDEASTREQVSRVLAARGYRLTVAENGERGVEIFREQPHDIVLTDIMMPRLNGLEMARMIRSLSPETQIACMTAFNDTSYLIEAIDIGVNQFVLKPIEYHRLFTALERCQEMVELRRHQKRLEAENLRTRKIEAVGILAGGMAHDFNNLLQVILGYVTLARTNAEPGSKTESLLAIVEQTSERARELSERLLTFARGGVCFMKPTPPGELIRESVVTVLKEFPAVKLVIELPEDLPLVMLDVDQMNQVITNLAINACEAMMHGGVLHVSASTEELTEANDLGLPSGVYLHIRFEDTGIGIPPENLPNIFDPYFSTKEMGSQKGMGLGLALSHSIIKNHQGHLHAVSKSGAGTGIHIHLHVADSIAAEAPPDHSPY